MKRRILSRYDETEDVRHEKGYRPRLVDADGKPIVSGGKKKGGAKQVRYLDGRIVSTKGERFITEKVREEDPSTFVSLKVKTKGKRGKGYR